MTTQYLYNDSLYNNSLRLRSRRTSTTHVGKVALSVALGTLVLTGAWCAFLAYVSYLALATIF